MDARPPPLSSSPRPSFLCRLGWHAPRKGALWNQGYYFTRCTRCGADLVRTTFSGWEAPRGQRVVWRTRAEPDQPDPQPELPAPSPPSRPARRAPLVQHAALPPSATVHAAPPPPPPVPIDHAAPLPADSFEPIALRPPPVPEPPAPPRPAPAQPPAAPEPPPPPLAGPPPAPPPPAPMRIRPAPPSIARSAIPDFMDEPERPSVASRERSVGEQRAESAQAGRPAP